MTKVLITFGDSWPGNAENPTGIPYGQILANTYGYSEFYNYGTAGASNEDMLFQFQKHYAEHHKPDHRPTAIFFLTYPGRTTQYPRSMSMQTSIPELQEVVLHLCSDEMQQMRAMTTVSTLQCWCQNLGFDDWYFAGWNRYEHWLPGVNLEKVWAQGRETAADWFGATKHNGEHLLDVGDNPYIRPNFAHPNQLGHQLIADKLAQWTGLTSKQQT